MNDFAKQLFDFGAKITAPTPVEAITGNTHKRPSWGGVKQPTSRWARQSVDTLAIRDKVLLELHKADATDQELEARMKLAGNTIRPSRGECVKKKWVVATGDTRLTPAGRKANIWMVTEKGKQQAGLILDRLV
jgi:hypothetical protein